MLLAHEHQHNETMLQLLQMVDGYEPAERDPRPAAEPVADGPEMVAVAGGAYEIGAGADGFAYDNERPRHEVELAAVPDRPRPGHQRRLRRLRRRDRRRAAAVLGARRRGRLGLDDLRPPRAARPGAPGLHVDHDQADAFAAGPASACRPSSSGRPPPRRPTATRQPRPLAFGCAPAGAYADAASDCGAVQMLGDVWEWTSSDFEAYPGFEAFPYPEYSEVFFGDGYKVLRGGSWATRRNVIRTSFRNWDLAERRQIFSGFRCAQGRRHERARRPSRSDRDRGPPARGRRARRAWPRTSARASPARSRSCRRSTSTTSAARSCSSRSPSCPSTTRPLRARDPRRPRRPRSSPPATPRTLIELGSGAAAKTRVLLDAMRDAGSLETYVPVDISEEITRRVADELVDEYPGLQRPRRSSATTRRHLERIPRPEGALIAFLGGTIGNFRPAPRRSFLARIATLMYPGDRFLLGTDLVKDARRRSRPPTTTPPASPPSSTRTSSHVLNRELDANFDLDAFEHVAFWDADNEWIDIRLRSLTRAVRRPPRARHARPLRPQRGDAHRDLDQVHARADRVELRRRRPRADRVVDRPGGPLRALAARRPARLDPARRQR